MTGRHVLWRGAEVVAVTRGVTQSPPSWQATGVSYKLMSVRPGDLFVATRDDKLDRHRYVGPALEAGAVAVLVDRDVPGVPLDAPLVRVDDCVKALERLSQVARDRTDATVVAITGSVGKTFMKDALHQVLSRQGTTVATHRNNNDTRGVMVTLARVPPEARYVVVEVSLLGPTSVLRKALKVRPHVALVTRIDAAHLAYHESIESIADAKARILDGLEPGGTAILNLDDPFFDRLAAHARTVGVERVLTYGADPASDIRALEHGPAPGGDRTRVVALVQGRSVEYELRLRGIHHVMNTLGVLAAVYALGADFEPALAVLAELRETPRRGNRYLVPHGEGEIELIDYTWNAQPASMRAGFEALANTVPGHGGRRIAVLGDITGLGRHSARLHRALADPLLACGVDRVFTAGREISELHAALPDERRAHHAQTVDDLIPMLVGDLRAGDTVLVQGGNEVGMRLVVMALVDASRYRSSEDEAEAVDPRLFERARRGLRRPDSGLGDSRPGGASRLAGGRSG